VDQTKGSLTPNSADQQTPQMIYGNSPHKSYINMSESKRFGVYTSGKHYSSGT